MSATVEALARQSVSAPQNPMNALKALEALSPRSMAAVAAALATAAAFSIQSWAQSILPTTPMALILALEPVFAWITSFVVTGERLAMVPGVGAILILVGIALTELIPQPHVPTAHEA